MTDIHMNRPILFKVDCLIQVNSKFMQEIKEENSYFRYRFFL